MKKPALFPAPAEMADGPPSIGIQAAGRMLPLRRLSQMTRRDRGALEPSRSIVVPRSLHFTDNSRKS